MYKTTYNNFIYCINLLFIYLLCGISCAQDIYIPVDRRFELVSSKKNLEVYKDFLDTLPQSKKPISLKLNVSEGYLKNLNIIAVPNNLCRM
ncbi:hypothetical protein IAD21_01320 [Abditibacteriota bacterium]|nr:hypothetical protein IAD21_01320 [Abditibacteriota bacterium]